MGASRARSGGEPSCGGGQDASGGWLPDFPHEAFELHRRESNQGAGRRRRANEGVRHLFGAERESPGGQIEPRVGHVEGELTVEDVEPLVFLGVHVPRRSEPGGYDDLQHAELAARVGPAILIF